MRATTITKILKKKSDKPIGLGLPLSYDIVKAHGGELRVETKEGEGSEFIISFTI